MFSYCFVVQDVCSDCTNMVDVYIHIPCYTVIYSVIVSSATLVVYMLMKVMVPCYVTDITSMISVTYSHKFTAGKFDTISRTTICAAASQ